MFNLEVNLMTGRGTDAIIITLFFLYLEHVKKRRWLAILSAKTKNADTLQLQVVTQFFFVKRCPSHCHRYSRRLLLTSKIVIAFLCAIYKS